MRTKKKKRKEISVQQPADGEIIGVSGFRWSPFFQVKRITEKWSQFEPILSYGVTMGVPHAPTTTVSFSVADYCVLVITLVVSSGIGVYYRFSGGRQKTTQEFYLGDHKQHIVPVAFSLMASITSAITLLGVSAELYSFGIGFTVISVSYLLFTPVAAFLYLPVFFKLQATSAYEYLELRFSRSTRVCASFCYSLQILLYMGIALYAPAIALEAVTGLNQFVSIMAVGLVCTFYSTIGGMKALILTDFVQSLLMFAAIFSVIICAAIEVGGVKEIWRIASEHGRTHLFNWSADPTEHHTVWGLVIGGGLTFMSVYAVNQTQVQRYLTMKDESTAVSSLFLSSSLLTLLTLTTGFSGLAIFSKYHDCDPIKSGRIASSDQLLPLYVVETMSHIPGAAGLFTAGIFSASLSTVSACFNSLAAVTLEDYVKPAYAAYSGKPLAAKQGVMLSKLLVLCYGGVCIAVAYLAHILGGILQATLSILGIVGGPLLATFTLGMAWPPANQYGAISAIITGLTLSLWLAFSGPKPPLPRLSASIADCLNFTLFNTTPTEIPISHFSYLHRINYLWYIVIGFTAAIVVGIAISYCTSFLFGYQSSSNPALFMPPLATFLRKRQAQKV